MKLAKSNQAFTLVELLVVVLIVGILAAIAIPQYQAAVLKSRLTSFLPLMNAIKNAQEHYFIENGYYAANLTDLDIQPPASCEAWEGYENMWFCGNEWYIDNVLGDGKPYGFCHLYFCPGNTNKNYTTCIGNNRSIRLEFYYDNKTDTTQYPSMIGKKSCTGFNSVANKVCQQLQLK